MNLDNLPEGARIARQSEVSAYMGSHVIIPLGRGDHRFLCWPVAKAPEKPEPVYREHRPARNEPGGLTLDPIMRAVCEAFGTEKRWIRSQRRNRKHIEPRLAFYLLADEFSEQSLPTIGRFICRDHTTVMHGVKRGRQVLADDPDFAARYEKARKIIEEGKHGSH